MERRMPKRHISQTTTPAKKMAKNITGFAFFAGLLAIVAIAFFYSHQNKKEDEAVTLNAMTEVERLINKDLEVGYPDTPAEVMKLFGRMNQCIYNTGMKDEEFGQLLIQMRLLYSQNLLSQNSYDEQMTSLKNEITNFREKKRRIINYTVEKSSSVKYKTIHNQECAYVQMAYFMSESGNYTKSFQNYILVKEEGQWKILSFQKDVSNSNEKTEEKKG